ncbi:XRE family transcriptional regulator [Kitasatospora gansuensis]
MISVRFSGLLREFRRNSGLTQQELADLSALSVRAVRDLESGRVHRPRRETVRLLVTTLRLEGARRAAFEEAAAAEPAEPAPPNSPFTMLGRADEVRALLELLRSGGQRLISLTGLPGVGKTRLATEVAERLRASGWQICWHPGGRPPSATPCWCSTAHRRATLASLNSCAGTPVCGCWRPPPDRSDCRANG